MKKISKSLTGVDPKLINKSEVARRLGVSSSYAYRLLKGERRSEKYEKLILEIIDSNKDRKNKTKKKVA